MFRMNYTMTISQYLEYERLSKKKPSMSEAELYTAITGSFLCLGKTLFSQLGFTDLSEVFFNCSQTFFWILIILNIQKGIKKTCNPKTKATGIYQLIGSGISTIFMLH